MTDTDTRHAKEEEAGYPSPMTITPADREAWKSSVITRNLYTMACELEIENPGSFVSMMTALRTAVDHMTNPSNPGVDEHNAAAAELSSNASTDLRAYAEQNGVEVGDE